METLEELRNTRKHMEGQWTWTWQWLIGQLAKKKRAEHWEAVADVRLTHRTSLAPPPKTSPSARAFCRVRSRAAPTMILLLADLAVATAAAGGLALLLASLTFASHAWFASVPQRPAAGTSALRGDEDPTGALFAFMLKGYGLALIVTHLHAWCDGPLATQRGQSAAAPMPTRPPTGPTRPRACSRLPSGLASRGLVI